MKSQALVLAFVLVTGLSAVYAQETEQQQDAGSGSNLEHLDADSEEAEAAAEDTSADDRDRLTREMAWHTSLKDAVIQARKDKKLVFWVQILGKMDGDT